MQILLGCLMCLVLTISQGFAISGGPVYGGSGVVTTGNYAGLFVPTTADNSLGLFTATISKTGLGTGTLALFRNGFFYPGTIQAIADPDSAVLTGVVNSSFNITFTSETSGNPPTTKNIVITFNANGSIDAKIRANPKVFSTASARIKGTAAITYATVGSAPGFNSDSANSTCSDPANPGATIPCPIPYKVKGFKQSEVSQ